MDYTEDQLRQFQGDFARRRRNQLAMSLPVVLLMVAFVFTLDENAGTVFGLSVQMGAPIFLVAIVGLLVFSWRNWRCPACSKYLGRAMNPRHCQACGVQLRG